MADILTLNLGSDIIYEESDITFDKELARILDEEDGFDSIFIYEASTLKQLKSGVGNLYKEEEHKNKVILKKGSYLFKQLPLSESENEAISSLMPYISSCSIFYIRLLKESKLEAIMQLFILKSL